MLSKLFDLHTHSNFSPDSQTTISQAAEAALQTGLAGFAITDHYDFLAPGEGTRFIFEPSEQQREIDATQPQFPIKILKGIELGLLPYNLEKMAEKLEKYSFDVVIASLHVVDELDPYYDPYYQDKSAKEAYGRYLELFYTLAKEYQDFDILGHLDYIVRYAPYKERILRYREHADTLDALFKFLIENGKALELNSATYRDRGGVIPVLDIDIIKRYIELGGELFSLGSDAHTSDRFGVNFIPLLHLIKSCGARYITHFENRKLYAQKIEL